MARPKRTIQNIEAQRRRALNSIDEVRTYYSEDGGSVPWNAYVRSQRDAFLESGNQKGDPISYGRRRADMRISQIKQAANNAIERLRQQGKDYRAARKARGLSAG